MYMSPKLWTWHVAPQQPILLEIILKFPISYHEDTIRNGLPFIHTSVSVNAEAIVLYYLLHTVLWKTLLSHSFVPRGTTTKVTQICHGEDGLFTNYLIFQNYTLLPPSSISLLPCSLTYAHGDFQAQGTLMDTILFVTISMSPPTTKGR